ncbi:MAG: SDR family NAD(P)-dependent oxidoreductase [Myxococcales bacterium]
MSTSPRPAAPSALRRALRAAAWTAVVASFPVWFAAFLVVPFLPVEAATRVALGAACLAAGELLFWVGGFYLGAEVIAKFRAPKVRTGKSFAGRRVAVFGATGGLGGAIARAVRREGGELLLVGRDAEKLAALAAELGAQAHPVDLADAAQIESVAQRLGTVHHVVSAAGVDVRKPFAQHDVADIDAQLQVDLRAPMLLARALVGRVAPGGTLALVGGFGDGRLALPYYAADVAARAGLAGFCEALNRELAIEGVDVRLAYVCPAPADTAAERPFADLWARMGTKLVPPERVADVVLQALLARRPRTVMGWGTRLLSWLEGAWPALGALIVRCAFGPALKARFGTAPDRPKLPDTFAAS